MEKIKLVSVLAKHLALGDKNLPASEKSEIRQEIRLQSATAIAEGVEKDLLNLPPQYKTLYEKFAGMGRAQSSILLVPDKMLEEVWKVEEPKLIDEFDNVSSSLQPLKQILGTHRREKDQKQREENLASRNEAMEKHKQELVEKGKFQRALNIFNFYKLGECLAAKLEKIFAQNNGQQNKEQMGRELKEKYGNLHKQFQQAALDISRHFLQDPRGKNIQAKLTCPLGTIIFKLKIVLKIQNQLRIVWMPICSVPSRKTNFPERRAETMSILWMPWKLC